MDRSRAAYYRARRWKKSPLKRYRVRMGKGGRNKSFAYRVRYVDAFMRQWITEEQISAAIRLCGEKNQ